MLAENNRSIINAGLSSKHQCSETHTGSETHTHTHTRAGTGTGARLHTQKNPINQ